MAVLRLLGISGSLRAASTNTALLRAAQTSTPPGVALALYDGLARLPIFNPDTDPEQAPEVLLFRRVVEAADGLVIAAPEYARGIPGGLKNALDWLVGGPEFPEKPVTLFQASARAAVAPAALAEVLRTMSAHLVPEASVTIPLLGSDPGASARILREPANRRALRVALGTFAARIEERRAGSRASIN